MTVRLAVFGDVHGNQNLMYDCALDWQEKYQEELDAILQVGDFETIRRPEDGIYYYAPPRHFHISDIAAYCDGEKRAPIMTAFIGGNHEAWGVLSQHPRGGFICPNVYYFGRSGVIDIKGVRIGGLTGVWGPKHYYRPLPETPDHSWQFYRHDAVEALKRESGGKPLDVLLLHDWVRPYSAIEITREKFIPPNVRSDTQETPTLELIQRTKPQYVYVGHMHGPWFEGKIGNSWVRALQQLRKESPDANAAAFRVLEFS